MRYHFSPQYAYCNLEKDGVLKHYTDIIYYNHSTISNDMLLFLQTLNIEIDWFYGWGPYQNQTLLEGKNSVQS